MIRSRVFVGIGGNVGNRLATLRSAVASIEHGAIPNTSVVAASPIYETHPVGPSNDPFFNAMIELSTSLEPAVLLRGLLEVEAAHGRRRDKRWEARTVDLDIVLWMSEGETGSQTIAGPDLNVPHPHACQRDFVLRPLGDLTRDAPVLQGRSAAEILSGIPVANRTILGQVDEPLWPTDTPSE